MAIEQPAYFSGSAYKTNWPLLVLLFLMPLRNIQIQYLPSFGGGLNTLNILFFLAFVHAMRHGKKLEVKPGINGYLIWYLISYLVALFIGYQFLGDAGQGNINHLKDQMLPILLVFVIQRSAVDEVQWRRILIAILLPLPYCFKIVWSQYASVSSWHYSDDLRIRGPFMDLGANEMGAFMVSASLIAMCCLITAWKYTRFRYFCLIVFLCAGMSVVYSYSRGGYLAFLFGAIVVIFKYRNTAKILVPIIFIGLIGIANLPASVTERFTTIGANKESRDESAESRFVFWEVAFARFGEKPVLGWGYRTVQDPRINPHKMDTHNFYVKMLVEGGLVAFITFVSLLIMLWRMGSRTINWEKNDGFRNAVSLALVGTTAALMLGNMFGDRFSHYPMITIYWVLVGLVSVTESRRLSELRRERQQHAAEAMD